MERRKNIVKLILSNLFLRLISICNINQYKSNQIDNYIAIHPSILRNIVLRRSPWI
ncbi:hypothetical protein ETAE_0909 [Edwardsiella piscicida]|uniref:Uncharacterized protein n=1 Tax=Edwardsiella piscicida TaxID=1263550 RepID=A0AAU8PEH7_EDWPI|nr:hypothetical protein ETAE_0909 [Edwardsiella tarda EIB202]